MTKMQHVHETENQSKISNSVCLLNSILLAIPACCSLGANVNICYMVANDRPMNIPTSN